MFLIKNQFVKLTIFIMAIAMLMNIHVYAQTDDATPEPTDKSLASEQLDESESDPFRRSGSPYMRIPIELMDAEPISLPELNSISEETSSAPLEVVLYDFQSRQEARMAVDMETAETELAELQSIASYQGLLPQPRASYEIESVIGSDGRSEITNTAAFPWRTITKLYITFENGATSSCSGAVISNFHVLTAGHCIHNRNTGFAESVRVVPGQDDDYTPFYSSWGTHVRYYTRWVNNQDRNHDWAVVTLDRNIGKYTGWMGRQTAGSGHSIYRNTMNVAGYPVDRGGTCCMYFDADSTHSVNDHKHWYRMDTGRGMSGGPVWRLENGNRYILTIHTNGIDSKGVNSGVRLNGDKYDRIIEWMNEDRPPTDRPDLIDDGQEHVAFSPRSLAMGSSITIKNDVRNVGTAKSGSFYVSYYASKDRNITPNDYLIGEKKVSSINPFVWKESKWSGKLPNNIPPGTYYIGWIIDRRNTVREFGENNNRGFKIGYKLTIKPVTPVNAKTNIQLYEDRVELTWQPAAGAESYEIYRSQKINGPKTHLGNTSKTFYADQTAKIDTTYYYFIKARSANGQTSEFSDPIEGKAGFNKRYLPFVSSQK